MKAKNIIESCKEEVRGRMVHYTVRAYHLIPEMKKPRMLDIGCGAGAPTVELARLGKGHVVGLDSDQSLLDKLRQKMHRSRVDGKISVVCCSLHAPSFLDESFDIVWAEGSIVFIGFEEGLREWKRLLRPGGYVVVHDDACNALKKVELIGKCGYELIAHFSISNEIWWEECYEPLQERFDKLRQEYARDEEFLELLDQEQEEIDNVRKGGERYASVFFIMKK